MGAARFAEARTFGICVVRTDDTSCFVDVVGFTKGTACALAGSVETCSRSDGAVWTFDTETAFPLGAVVSVGSFGALFARASVLVTGPSVGGSVGTSDTVSSSCGGCIPTFFTFDALATASYRRVCPFGAFLAAVTSAAGFDRTIRA